MSAAENIAIFAPDQIELAAERLPTSERAAFHWSAEQIRRAVHRLMDVQVDSETLAEVAFEVLKHSRDVMSRLGELGQEVSPALMGEGIADAARAIADDGDAAAADALSWSWSKMAGLVELAAGFDFGELAGRFATVSDTELRQAVREPGGAIFRVNALVFALLEALRIPERRPVASELAWRVFDETCVLVDAIADVMEPTPSDAASFSRAAGWLRSVLDESDLAAIDDARMRELRG